MNKNTLAIVGAILFVGLAGIGAFIYVQRGNLAVEKQKLEQQKERDRKEDEEKEQKQTAEKVEELSNTLQYDSCVQNAEKARDRDLAANSTYETTDENGGTIYHGNAQVFDNIDRTAQEEKTRCARLYQ